MSSWQPQPEGLEQLLSLLRDSLSPNTQVQQAVTQRLETFNAIPDYNSYLAHVLIKQPQQEERVRSVAGLILKNNIKFGWKSWPGDSQEYVKSILVDGISDPAVMVRSTTGTAIVAILEECGPENWPLALSRLMASIDSSSIQEQEGAFSTLAKVCEDMYKKLDCEIAGVRPLDFMIPKFIQMLNHQSAKVRIHALSCLNSFIPTQSASFLASIDHFIAALFQRASDGVPEVRQHVCSALVRLLASRPDKLTPEMNNVATFMLYSTQDKNEEVALEACEFWLTFAEENHLIDHLRPLLDRVAPVLLNTMVYSDTELVILQADEDDDDAAVPDKDSDIKPHIYGGKTHTQSSENDNQHQKMGRDAEIPSDEEDEEDFDELDDDELTSEWTLRKCSAAALDILSINFPVELLNILLPYLKERLFSQDWLQKESAILALGAIAEGCIEGIQPHLPQLVPYLVNSLNDSKPLIRSISCWALARYSSWSVQPISVEHRNNYFVPTMEGLLRMVHDKNKRVQEAGCSAFATLEEEAGKELEPFLKPIIEHLVYAFQKYQRKNLLILYDAIGTLADAVTSALDNEEYVTLLMQPLIDKWQNLADDDEDIIPLFECLSSLTVAAGSSFIKFAQPVYERCSRIVHGNLMQFQTAVEQNDEDNIPDRTFIIVALDLISGMIQGLGSNAQELIIANQSTSSTPSLLNLLLFCLKHPDSAVKQSAYALVGDLAVSCFPILIPVLGTLLPDLIQQIEIAPTTDAISVCNNAAWAAGEIATSYTNYPDLNKDDFIKYVPSLTERLVPILLHPKSVKSLAENAAVTIGRIGLVCPEIVAPHLQVFAAQWCESLWEIKDNEEKDTTSFQFFCNAVVRWTSPSAVLNEQFNALLHSFKAAAGVSWDAQMTALPQPISTRLRERYGNMRSVGSGKEGVIRKTAYNTRYTLAEIARLLRELLVTPSPRMNMLGISVEMLEHTNVLRCYLTGVCEEINKVNGIDDEQRAAIDEIITTHRDHKYASKYNIAVKAIKMLHIHETNLTELTPKRPETVKLRDKYLPHKDENGAERNEIYYYAIKAKKMVNECRRVGLGDKEVLERLYGNEELSRRKREIIDIALPFLQKYLDRCEHDWVTTINFTHPQYAPVDEKCRRFAHVTWLDSGRDMYLRPERVTVHDLTPRLGELRATPASTQLDDRGYAVVQSAPRASLEPLDEQGCIAEVRELLMHQLQAEQVLVWNLQHRDGSGHNDAEGTLGTDAAPTDPVPAYRAHVDQDAKRAWEHIQRELGELPDNATRRVQIINVWRPCFDGVVDVPLAVCDGNTVSHSDLGHTTDFFGSHYSILHNSSQRWSYIRDQNSHDVFFLRCFDSLDGDGGRARFVPHTAVEDRSRECFKSRQSVELRCIVVTRM
ncbi:hypothetical protein E3P86_02950 [Wallemia ichthyophaga]|uniref:Importin N-terminal domain-containing protein n=1 Tax=Wallemia ichthyophaga TaxID=245174 RepID=A0A4T0IY82_WALIC|nr:hypothetical protein E3P86_02950 [Wallemia ichthyophaga]